MAKAQKRRSSSGYRRASRNESPEIALRSPEEIALIARSAQIVREALDLAGERVAPGVTTEEIDAALDALIRKRGGRPAFKGYRGYPASVCASVNHEVVHGIPGERVLQEGEIVSVDVGVACDGYYADSARTYAVGRVSAEREVLMAGTRSALEAGIAQAAPGKRVGDISHAIQEHVESLGFTVVRQLVGHGVGQSLHEEPQVPNYGRPGTGPRLAPGMVLAIEPMVNVGGPEVEWLSDRWTVVTADRSDSAHFEHTVAVTESGPHVLTAEELKTAK
jgi:methionyl aminopeptidase